MNQFILHFVDEKKHDEIKFSTNKLYNFFSRHPLSCNKQNDAKWKDEIEKKQESS